LLLQGLKKTSQIILFIASVLHVVLPLIYFGGDLMVSRRPGYKEASS
jgi:hypothetical protein